MNNKHRSLQLEKIGSFLFLFFIWTQISVAQDQKVVATVSANEMSLGQSLIYRISAEPEGSEEVGEPRLPDLDGFDLVNRSQGMESRSEFVNGKFSFVKKQVFTYVLRPRKSGDLTIGRSEIVVGEKTYSTEPIQIRVVAGGGQGGGQADMDAEETYDTSAWDEADELFNQILKRSLPQAREVPKLNDKEAFFIRVELDKRQAYVGEQVTASWYLYTKNTLTNFEPIKYPDLKGFWKEDIEIATRLNFQTEVINGIPYRKALLVSYALFPIKPGTATIDTYKLRASAVMSNSMGAFGRPYTFTKANAPEKIEVLPLPPGQPQDFHGAVGQFSLSTKVDKSQVPANEPFDLTLKIEGRGNAKQIELPTLNLAENLETFDTRSESKFFKNGTSYKNFSVLIIPRQEGKMEIPPITMSYFNPQTKAYEQTRSQGISIHVGAGKALGLAGSQPLQTPGGVSSEKPLVLPDPLFEVPGVQFLSRSRNVLFLSESLAFLLAFLFFVFKGFGGQGEKEKLLSEVGERMKIISGAQKSGNYREAGVQAMNLVDFVLTELTQEYESHTYDELLKKVAPGIQSYFADDFRKSVRYFETLGFAPETISEPLKNSKLFNQSYQNLKNCIYGAVKQFESQKVSL